MEIVERKSIPVYEVTCFECGSRIRYKASETSYCHITCPVCRTLLWAMTLEPVDFIEEAKKDDTTTKTVTVRAVVHCNECKYANQCSQKVQMTTRNFYSTTIEYENLDFCSRGERNE